MTGSSHEFSEHAFWRVDERASIERRAADEAAALGRRRWRDGL